MDRTPRGRPVVWVVEEPHALVNCSRVQFAAIHKQVHNDGERKRSCESDQDNQDNRGKGVPHVTLANNAILIRKE